MSDRGHQPWSMICWRRDTAISPFSTYRAQLLTWQGTAWAPPLIDSMVVCGCDGREFSSARLRRVARSSGVSLSYVAGPACRLCSARPPRGAARRSCDLSTFGPDGPTRCSGLETVRYDAQSLHGEFGRRFRLV